MREVKLTNSNLTALVDDKDYEKVALFSWQLYENQAGNIYAFNSTIGPMHRVIMRISTSSTDVDHKDANGLNNQKSNLRLCTRSQNLAGMHAKGGASSYKGVSFCKDTGRWRAKIWQNYRQFHLGRFDTEEQAARAYDTRAVLLFGDFARLNFPKED